MRYSKRTGEPLYVHVHISDFDHDTVEAMDDIISQLNMLVGCEKMRCGSDNMITYHLNRAIEYARRERNDAIKRYSHSED